MGAILKGHKDSPVAGWAREKVAELFGADLRSLAVFRMVLAVLVLADLAYRATDLTAHYTDAGVLPRDILVQEELNRWSFSLNLMNGELYFQVFVFGIGALAALALLAGYRTRLAGVIVWVVMISIQWRNPLVGTAGDTLLRMLLFWSMFLPLGAYWSVDRALKVAPPSRLAMRFLSFATFGLFLQIAFMYWFTAIKKTGPEWRVNGSAIYYALSLDQIAKPIGAYLLNFPTLLEVLTFATLGFEFVGPLLLFFPLLTGPVRTVSVLAFMSFHYGIWLTMSIGIFPWISAFCMVCFLPAWFWEKACPTVLPRRPAMVSRLQRAVARLLHPYKRSLPFPRRPPLENIGQPSAGRTTAHDEVQPGGYDHRSLSSLEDTTTPQQSQRGSAVEAGANGEQEIPQGAPYGAPHGATAKAEPIVLRSSLATNLLAVFFLLYIFIWNLTSISVVTMPERIVPLGHILGLKQDWSMFAPFPTKTDGWYVIPGTLSNSDQQVDLMAFIRGDADLWGKGVSWQKPSYVNGTFKNEHWRKYLESIREEDNAELRKDFGRYICREWNAQHAGEEALKSLQIAYIQEKTLPNYQKPALQKTVLAEHTCS